MEKQPCLFIAPKSCEEQRAKSSSGMCWRRADPAPLNGTFITPSPASRGCLSLQDSGLFLSHPTTLSRSLAALLRRRRRRRRRGGVGNTPELRVRMVNNSSSLGVWWEPNPALHVPSPSAAPPHSVLKQLPKIHRHQPPKSRELISQTHSQQYFCARNSFYFN